MDTYKILLIDDDVELGNLLRDFLSHHQIDLEITNSGEEGLELLEKHQTSINSSFDLLILDIMLPGISGLEVLKEIRKEKNIPIIMLTASGEDHDRILGLELGADDYLPKPFNSQELVARVKAILRRSYNHQNESSNTFGNIKISQENRKAYYSNKDLNLTGTEFEILCCLTISQGETVSKDKLSEEALGRQFIPYDRSIDTHISNLRAKLKNKGAPSDLIYSKRGIGYALLRD
jgi:two-component system response regulator CpxR